MAKPVNLKDPKAFLTTRNNIDGIGRSPFLPGDIRDYLNRDGTVIGGTPEERAERYKKDFFEREKNKEGKNFSEFDYDLINGEYRKAKDYKERRAGRTMVEQVKQKILKNNEISAEAREKLVKLVEMGQKSGSVHSNIYDKEFQKELEAVRGAKKYQTEQRAARTAVGVGGLTAQSRGEQSTILGGVGSGDLSSILGGK